MNTYHLSELQSTASHPDVIPIWTPNVSHIDGKPNTSEFVFKLNLPPITERFTSAWQHLMIPDDIPASYTEHRELLSPEWKHWKGIKWPLIIRFCKNNFVGRIHIDNDIGDESDWGINWICSGYGTVDFWLKNQIKLKSAIKDECGNKIQIFTAFQSPAKQYVLPPGAYLFNAGIPHLPAGYNNRLVFSMRPEKNPTRLSWAQAIDHFQEFM